MPKSAKKRKEKAADFSKAKLKLGKGKKAPSNAIDTSFKARSIALPQQSILAQKGDSTPTTKRKLSLDDLFSHLKHYSASTRKDALNGLRELLEAHPGLITTSLTDIISACVRLIADDDASVRRTLHSFMAWLLPQVPTEDIMPHSPLLVLFTTSAQTHIFPEIRVDAVKFLGLLLEYIPSAVTSGWYEENAGHGSRILEGYLGLLSAGTKFGEAEGPAQATSTASVVLTPASKLVVLRSLSSFLGLALSSHNHTSADLPKTTMPTWFFSASFATKEAYEAFDSLLRPTPSSSVRHWKADVDPQGGDDGSPHIYPSLETREDSLKALSDLLTFSSEFSGAAESSTSKEFTFLTNLARSLHGTLVATYLDCAPAVFAPSGNPNETDLQLVLVIGKISMHIYGSLLRSASLIPDSTLDELRALLGYMSPHFPFAAHGSRDIKVEQAYQELNLIYCELSSLLMLQASRPSTNAPQRRKAGKQRATPLSNEAERVCAYVIQLLDGEGIVNTNGNTLGRSLSPSEYTALLPTIWSLLNSEITETGALFSALLQHATQGSSKSAIKRQTIEFIGYLILLNLVPQYRGTFRADRSDVSAVVKWLEDLPKTLWELGIVDISATEVILRLLLRMCQWRSSFFTSTTSLAIATRLAPYFHISHPQKGALPGPWIRLPPSLRRLAMDMVAMLLITESVPGLENAINLAVTADSSVEEERLYWTRLRETLRK